MSKWRAFGLIVAILLIATLSYSVYSLDQENKVYRHLFLVMGKAGQNNPLAEKAVQYYDVASQKYDLEDYSGAISNCEISREYSSEYAQSLRELRIYVVRRPERIFGAYSDLINENINIYNDRYESCEYLEAASRQYKAENYIGGGESIRLLNEVIAEHDIAVERHNSFLAQYNYELEILGGDSE